MDELVTFLNGIDSGYRSELKEINELNFARFDDKLERRFAEMDTHITERFAEMDTHITKRFAQMDARFTDRFTTLEKSFADLKSYVETRLSQTETRLVVWMFVLVATGTLAVLGLK